jgi:hypothetical protein
MRSLILTVAAATALTAGAAAGAAQAQPHRYDRDHWTSINQRQSQLDRRIDRGIRNGQLTRREAVRLRDEFHDIARLEQRYRRNGLSGWERADLDRRFDRLSARIRWDRRDGQRYGWNDYPRYLRGSRIAAPHRSSPRRRGPKRSLPTSWGRDTTMGPRRRGDERASRTFPPLPFAPT